MSKCHMQERVTFLQHEGIDIDVFSHSCTFILYLAGDPNHHSRGEPLVFLTVLSSTVFH